MLWDSHMHCCYSGDSEAAPEDMAAAAAARGLPGICFTDHLDLDYPDDPDYFSLDIAPRAVHLAQLADAWQGRLEIRCGIELGLQPQLRDAYHALLLEHDFDFVIGSSHVVHGFDPYYPAYFEQKTEAEAYREYFSSILENIRSCDDFDVYGHLDYVVRYGPNKNKYYSYARYKDIMDAILTELIARGKGIELNTGGFKAGLGQPNPCCEVVRRYRQLGGEIITLGADAHAPAWVGYEFRQAADILREAGFTHYTVFRERKPEFLPLG
ncbi:MAG: histidinol-phosphatase HisJ family protein [Lachnospiraceae bacterium]|nr:histidinol-phosphatase HisJ family protein [Lachnospiraceae bacterium]